MGLGLREACLDVSCCTAPFVHSRTIAVAWEERVVVGWVVASAAVQMDTYEGLGVDTEADSALGETGQIIELSGLQRSLSDPRRLLGYRY